MSCDELIPDRGTVYLGGTLPLRTAGEQQRSCSCSGSASIMPLPPLHALPHVTAGTVDSFVPDDAEKNMCMIAIRPQG